MIEVKEIQKKYGDFKALNDVSFNIEKGEVVGFLGPNGAGKTTMMKIITCFMPPTSGYVKVLGHDTIESSLEVRKLIGYLPESAPLYTEMEVSEYLRFIAGMRNIPKSKIDSQYRKVVEICGLSEKVRMPIETLSKGYKQRVGLAQALIHEPEILILDEPTSGLDPNQIIEIRELIKKLGKEKTIILSSHILPEVSATCNRVIIINRGQIVAEGEPDKLVEASQSGEIVHVKIEGPKATIEKALSKIKDVTNVGLLEDVEKMSVFKVTRKEKSKSDLRKDIFDAVVKNKWVLYEMNSEEKSLEEVFINLTKEEKYK